MVMSYDSEVVGSRAALVNLQTVLIRTYGSPAVISLSSEYFALGVLSSDLGSDMSEPWGAPLIQLASAMGALVAAINRQLEYDGTLTELETAALEAEVAALQPTSLSGALSADASVADGVPVEALAVAVAAGTPILVPTPSGFNGDAGVQPWTVTTDADEGATTLLVENYSESFSVLTTYYALPAGAPVLIQGAS